MTVVPESPPPRAPLPPVATRLAWTEWLFVAAVWLLVLLAFVGPVGDDPLDSGARLLFRDFFAIRLVEWLVWLGLLWPLFALLDATPLEHPRRVAHALVRGAAWLGLAAAHSVLTHALLLALVSPLRLGAVIWQLRPATPLGSLGVDIVHAAIPFAAYALLRRAHRRRLELARAADLERSLLRARLHALDLELRPHFLFNTLNAITALVRSEPAKAERMLITLSNLLRVTLGRTGREVTVEDELDQLDLYLDIQRVRFRDRLDVKLEADVDVMTAYVPGMILQPLVENALTHGLGPKTAGGTIRISVIRDGGSVVLRVADDGVGLPAGGMRERTGVANTRERLRALYGDAQSVTISSRAEGGTVSEVRVPLRSAPTRTAEFPIPSTTSQRPPADSGDGGKESAPAA